MQRGRQSISFETLNDAASSEYQGKPGGSSRTVILACRLLTRVLRRR